MSMMDEWIEWIEWINRIVLSQSMTAEYAPHSALQRHDCQRKRKLKTKTKTKTIKIKIKTNRKVIHGINNNKRETILYYYYRHSWCRDAILKSESQQQEEVISARNSNSEKMTTTQRMSSREGKSFEDGDWKRHQRQWWNVWPGMKRSLFSKLDPWYLVILAFSQKGHLEIVGFEGNGGMPYIRIPSQTSCEEEKTAGVCWEYDRCSVR